MTAWFPQTIGHEPAKRALRNAIEGGRLGASLLFCGPRGTGRGLLARELAMAINCRDRGAQVPCGGCAPCRKIAAGTSGDCIVVQPQDRPSIGIDQVRAMLDELALAPVEFERRVFIIDPASALGEEAQNALLKGLEEPPARSLIVLIAEHEAEMLSTIASRCLLVRLSALSPSEVERVLEQRGLDPDEARARAAWGGGSPGEALEEDAAEVAQMGADTLARLAGGGAYADPMATIEDLVSFSNDARGEGASARRLRIGRVLRHVQRGLRDALVLRERGLAPERSALDPELLGRLAHLPPGRLERGLDLTVRVEEELVRNANTKLVLDGLVLDLGAALAPTR
jgi:DNA polymerase-3 subunit delta'